MLRVIHQHREAAAKGLPLPVIAPPPPEPLTLLSPSTPQPFKPVQRPVHRKAEKAQASPETIAKGVTRAEGLSNIQVTFNPPEGALQQFPPGSAEAVQGEANFDMLKRFWEARKEFGLSRIKMGAFLHLIKDHQMWRGVAGSWEGFLAQENVNSNAARQYIAVAKRFVFELDLPEKTLAKLSLAGITALEKAATTMTPENQIEVIAILNDLTERDAIQRMMELSKEDEPVKDKPSLRVLSILKQFSELPPDMQQQVKEKIMGNEKRRTAAREADDRAIHDNPQNR